MKLLDILNRNKGSFLSGEEIAREMEVSRNAVWKAAQNLRKEGVPVEAVRNVGYRIAPGYDVLTAANIEKHFRKQSNLRFEIYKTATSTNDLAKEQAARGEAEGKVILAESQSQGRGRMGREFFSPKGQGVYMSVILRPNLPAEKAVLVTSFAAVCVCLAIEKVCGEKAEIKWVNDVFIGEKKVCGILSEAAFSAETGLLDYIVLGIGVNVYQPSEGYPKKIQTVAGSLFCNEIGDKRSALAAEILQEFFAGYAELEQVRFLEDYKKRCFILGKEVWLIKGEEKTLVRALDIDRSCRLKVLAKDGEQTVSSGEVSIVW